MTNPICIVVLLCGSIGLWTLHQILGAPNELPIMSQDTEPFILFELLLEIHGITWNN